MNLTNCITDICILIRTKTYMVASDITYNHHLNRRNLEQKESTNFRLILQNSFHFLILVTFGMMSPAMYFQTKVLSELFLDSSFADDSGNMRESTQMTDFWKVN